MNPSTWPDGTPRSQRNAFTVTQDGRQIDWKPLLAEERRRAHSATTMDKRRKAGTANDFRGMSKKSDALRQPHGGAYMRAMAKAQKKDGAPLQPMSAAGRMRELLAERGPMTRRELAEAAGLNPKNVNALLANDVAVGRVDKDTSAWPLKFVAGARA